MDVGDQAALGRFLSLIEQLGSALPPPDSDAYLRDGDTLSGAGAVAAGEAAGGAAGLGLQRPTDLPPLQVKI